MAKAVRLKKYNANYQARVKQFVIGVHEEFGISYDFELDKDLENPNQYYSSKGGTFYMLIDSNAVVGTAAVKKIDTTTFELKRLYLDGAYRGKGLGQQLLNAAIAFCNQARGKKIILDTNLKQTAAQRLYLKNGFTIERRVKNTIFMSRSLE